MHLEVHKRIDQLAREKLGAALAPKKVKNAPDNRTNRR